MYLEQILTLTHLCQHRGQGFTHGRHLQMVVSVALLDAKELGVPSSVCTTLETQCDKYIHPTELFP